MNLVHLLLALHVVGGGTALITGPIPMLSRKGGETHRRWGRIFAISLTASDVFAIILSVVIHSDLLLTIAVLTLFLVISGVRALQCKRGGRPHPADKVGCIVLAAFALWLFWRSAMPLEVTGLFFAVFSLLLAWQRWQLLRARKPDWLLAHIQGMGGAYIATATAFLVVNLRFLPAPLTYIGPTLVGILILVRRVLPSCSEDRLQRTVIARSAPGMSASNLNNPPAYLCLCKAAASSLSEAVVM